MNIHTANWQCTAQFTHPVKKREDESQLVQEYEVENNCDS